MSHSISLRFGSLAVAVVLAVGTAGCGKVVRQGRASSYLIITKITATSGGTSDKESDELSSDVLTKGSWFEDLGTASFQLAMKDVGQTATPTGPTSNNYVTINRYHVSYRRADGRATPGVDVPYAFDGAGTVTVADKAGLAFVLVRSQAKSEPPLMNLINNGGAQAISTLADVTFYGRDQAGNDVSVTGSISVNFADWADPKN